jgi:putative transcriptional regulator
MMMTHTMFEHVDDWMMDLALGTAAGPELVSVEAHLAGCDRCVTELAATREVLASLPLALPALPPAPEVRSRLLAAAQGRSRFAPFLKRIAQIIQLSLGETEELVTALDDPERWVPGPIPNVTLLHFSGGPALQNAITGFVRIAPGGVFPLHKHLGDETVMILQGCCRHDDGSVARAGDVVSMGVGSQHELTALDDLLYLAVVHEGIEVGGQAMRASDPRY